MNGEAMLRQAARRRRPAAQGLRRSGRVMAAIAARWSLTLGQPVTPAQVVLCLIDLKLARLGHDPAHADSILDVVGYAAVLAGGAVMNAMKWHPRGYGGQRRAPDQVKRDGWREQGVLAVAVDDERLTWPERELVRQLGDKLYGKRAEAGP